MTTYYVWVTYLATLHAASGRFGPFDSYAEASRCVTAVSGRADVHSAAVETLTAEEGEE